MEKKTEYLKNEFTYSSFEKNELIDKEWLHTPGDVDDFIFYYNQNQASEK